MPRLWTLAFGRHEDRIPTRGGDVRFGGEPLGLDPQGVTTGAALLFARPHDVTIVPTTGEHRLVVKRIPRHRSARRSSSRWGVTKPSTAILFRCQRSTVHRLPPALPVCTRRLCFRLRLRLRRIRCLQLGWKLQYCGALACTKMRE